MIYPKPRTLNLLVVTWLFACVASAAPSGKLAVECISSFDATTSGGLSGPSGGSYGRVEVRIYRHSATSSSTNDSYSAVLDVDDPTEPHSSVKGLTFPVIHRDFYPRRSGGHSTNGTTFEFNFIPWKGIRKDETIPPHFLLSLGRGAGLNVAYPATGEFKKHISDARCQFQSGEGHLIF